MFCGRKLIDFCFLYAHTDTQASTAATSMTPATLSLAATSASASTKGGAIVQTSWQPVAGTTKLARCSDAHRDLTVQHSLPPTPATAQVGSSGHMSVVFC